MVPAMRIIEEARSLCGVPWKHRGRSMEGVDCIGLVILAAVRAGLDLFAMCGIHDQSYGRRPQRKLFELVQLHCRRADQLQPGCLLLFRFQGDAYARHFGIFTERSTVIHAECKARHAVIEHGYRSQWIVRTHSIWLLPGVEYIES